MPSTPNKDTSPPDSRVVSKRTAPSGPEPTLQNPPSRWLSISIRQLQDGLHTVYWEPWLVVQGLSTSFAIKKRSCRTPLIPELPQCVIRWSRVIGDGLHRILLLFFIHKI
ncbi:hypothetical protein CERSUDRAFT_119029 [Gelatoporia subvermispora B]|uniref:Uncharacterized protein n=1 Tax=Ceriporiopsis subvermispora (strain B) TaxID=914234 RepID=M2Q5C8_CERS8|nr:hypothetical protein CERSUDRAFT_119029 [Gelatoporia subvermispora B]